MEKKATLENVRGVMNEFRENEQKITIKAVVAKTGGSRSTVNPLMNTVYDEWAKAQAATDAPPGALVSAARPLWEVALKLAEQKYEEKERNILALMAIVRDKANEAEESLEVATLEAERLTTERDEKAAYAEALEVEVEEKEKLRLKAEEELAKAKAEIEALKAQLRNSPLLDEIREFMRRSESRQGSVATIS